MTVSLRERRRQQTAREIQLATLQLAIERGLENITTEEIAASAGVSTRTFFNYFTNKETAAVGAPPEFRQADMDALRGGTDPLQLDIKKFLDKHFEILRKDEPIIKMVGTILRSNEKARSILDSFMITERNALTECLSHRVENDQIAAALASSIMNTIRRTIFLWEEDTTLSLSAALDIVWNGHIEASNLLAATPKD